MDELRSVKSTLEETVNKSKRELLEHHNTPEDTYQRALHTIVAVYGPIHGPDADQPAGRPSKQTPDTTPDNKVARQSRSHGSQTGNPPGNRTGPQVSIKKISLTFDNELLDEVNKSKKKTLAEMARGAMTSVPPRNDEKSLGE